MLISRSRLWLPMAASSLAVLLISVTVISLKGRNAPQQPTIQDVFTGEMHEFSADLGQLPKIVPPTNYVATPPVNHGPQYRTVDWLKAQGSLAWTLQIISSEDEEVVKSYIAQRDDKEQFAYFMYKEGEKVSYIAVYGNFVTMELALGVANSIDFALPNGVRPSPEKFATYVANVPMIQPAIDQPPPPKYGGVPEIAIEPQPDDMAESNQNQLETPADSSSSSTEPEVSTPVVDPF
ncbi:MAG: hypothetical protein U1E99_12065 [Agitococcus sp.]